MRFNHSILLVLIYFLPTPSLFAQSEVKDQILSLHAPEKIGFKDEPVISVDIEVKKKRDLYVILQKKNNESWQLVKRNFKRIKKSGEYRMKVKLDDLAPGQYRWSSYITPRKKSWNDRIGNQVIVNMEVTDVANFTDKNKGNKPKETASEQVEFSNVDKIAQVEWPEKITDDRDHNLSIRYQVTTARDLNIKLYNSKNWKEGGSLKVPVTKSGEVNLPFGSLNSNFEAGKYAWVIYLTDSEGEPLQPKKFGKHFTIGEP